MNKGICVAGNLIVDITYPIQNYPKEGELTTITDGISQSMGGLVCNVITDLAKMDDKLPLVAMGVMGNDPEGEYIMQTMSQYPNIDTSAIKRDGKTSFTAVMSNNETKARTFYQYRGANAMFDETYIDWDNLDCDMLHIGYILLLDALDEADPEYGTRMAKLLSMAQAKGIKTSIDVVSESGNRYKTIVPPALKYTDYCVINEIEAGKVTGITLREDDDTLNVENIPAALKAMQEMGVGEWVVIHCPEGGYGIDKEGNYITLPSLVLPKGYIKGTVGAGDAFCAGVLYGAENGWSLEESIQFGICSAAASLSEKSASDGMRPVAEIKALKDLYAPK